MTPIALTGMGVISPYGVGGALLWQELLAGHSALTALTSFDTSQIHCRAGGQCHDLPIKSYLPIRLVRKLDRFSIFGLIAAQLAMEDAGLNIEALASPVADDALTIVSQAGGRDRVGITVGNNLGGWEFAERELYHLWRDGARAVSPYMATAWFPAAVQGNISIQFSLKGIGRTFLGDRASGAHALIHAAHCLRMGHADKMFAGGTEAPFAPFAMLCYESSGLMSHQASERPTSAYRPFDQEHDGLVPGEGAAFFMLERANDAVQRGARIYGTIVGWASTQDGYDPIRPEPTGERFAAAMTLAMRRAGVVPEDVDAIFAAGSAVPEEDESEVRAIRLAFGDTANTIPVTVPKAAFGNLFGAATSLDVAIALHAFQHRALPPTLNLAQIAPGCELNFVTGAPLAVEKLDVIAVNARGIGGANVSLILRRWQNNS